MHRDNPTFIAGLSVGSVIYAISDELIDAGWEHRANAFLSLTRKLGKYEPIIRTLWEPTVAASKSEQEAYLGLESAILGSLVSTLFPLRIWRLVKQVLGYVLSSGGLSPEGEPLPQNRKLAYKLVKAMDNLVVQAMQRPRLDSIDASLSAQLMDILNTQI